MRLAAIGMTLAVAMPAGAQTQMTQPPQVIQVAAMGKVETPPDKASIAFEIRGEGQTADEATGAMVAQRKAIEGGLAQLLGASMEFHTGELAQFQVRGRACDETSYGQRRLSSGDCAVVGYVATLSASAQTSAIKLAGTATGLVGRLGGSNVRLVGFTLRDDSAAQQRATAAAIANARAKAQAIADASGVKLGQLMRVQDGAFDDVVVTGARVMAPPPPPPPPPAPRAPIAVDLAPHPIETTSRVNVTFAIER